MKRCAENEPCQDDRVVLCGTPLRTQTATTTGATGCDLPLLCLLQARLRAVIAEDRKKERAVFGKMFSK